MILIANREAGVRVAVRVRQRRELRFADVGVPAGVESGEVGFAARAAATTTAHPGPTGSHAHSRPRPRGHAHPRSRAGASPGPSAPSGAQRCAAPCRAPAGASSRGGATPTGTELFARERAVGVAVTSLEDGFGIGLGVGSIEELLPRQALVAVRVECGEVLLAAGPLRRFSRGRHLRGSELWRWRGRGWRRCLRRWLGAAPPEGKRRCEQRQLDLCFHGHSLADERWARFAARRASRHLNWARPMRQMPNMNSVAMNQATAHTRRSVTSRPIQTAMPITT